jgi:hypothetical protein
MQSFRDIKRKARRHLHKIMQVAAFYVPDREDYLAPIIPVKVRVHYKESTLGGLKGTSFHTVEHEEIDPKIIFLIDEMPKPTRNAVVSVDFVEAYRIDTVEVVDDLTVTAKVIRLDRAEANLLPLRGLYFTDKNDPTTYIPVTVWVDYLVAPHRIKISPEVPIPALAATVTLRPGLAYQIVNLTMPYIQVAPLSPDAVEGLPMPSDLAERVSVA